MFVGCVLCGFFCICMFFAVQGVGGVGNDYPGINPKIQIIFLSLQSEILWKDKQL